MLIYFFKKIGALLRTLSACLIVLMNTLTKLQCTLVYLNACFTYDCQTFVQSIQFYTCHGCINNNININNYNNHNDTDIIAKTNKQQ